MRPQSAFTFDLGIRRFVSMPFDECAADIIVYPKWKINIVNIWCWLHISKCLRMYTVTLTTQCVCWLFYWIKSNWTKKTKRRVRCGVPQREERVVNKDLDMLQLQHKTCLLRITLYMLFNEHDKTAHPKSWWAAQIISNVLNLLRPIKHAKQPYTKNCRITQALHNCSNPQSCAHTQIIFYNW